MAKETPVKSAFSAKEMLREANEKKTVIKYGERVTLEIIENTKHYTKGQTIAPHKLVAEQLIKNKIAKEVK